MIVNFMVTKMYPKLCAFLLAMLIASPVVAQSNEQERVLYSRLYDKYVEQRDAGNVIQSYQYLSDLLWRYPRNQELRTELQNIQSPFTLANVMGNKVVSEWEYRPSQVQEFAYPKPEVPSLQERPPVLYKRQFETTAAFDRRVKAAEELYQQNVDQQHRLYREAMRAYQLEKDRHQKRTYKEKALRREKAVAMRQSIMNDVLVNILGVPQIEQLNYHPDDEVFVGYLASSVGNFRRKIEIYVPLTEAQRFYANLAQVRPLMFFGSDDLGQWQLADIVVRLNNTNYPAAWSQRPNMPDLHYKRVAIDGPLQVTKEDN